ncbi:MAG TPA: hypothetical protein VGH73_24575 [Thermoanaerobaculia bacterium]|jgi:hypothetical protein
MSMHEFSSRFAAKDETSILFNALRRVGGLDRREMLASAAQQWLDWPPVDDPTDPGAGTARA